jgi:5-methylcytosine-specific restriction endonuclease McrA
MSDNLKHLKIITLEEVFCLVGRKHSIKIIHDDVEYRIRIYGNKFKLFKNNRICCECGREGNTFVLDKQTKHKYVTNNNDIYSDISLNLYCYDPNDKMNPYVLMTKDHIIPKKYKGEDLIINLQTMCEVCNQEKGEGIRKKDIKTLIGSKKGRKYVRKHYNLNIKKRKIKYFYQCING